MVSAAPDVNDMHRSGKLPPDPFTGAEPINDTEPGPESGPVCPWKTPAQWVDRLANPLQRLSTGLAPLDELTRGGLPTGRIITVVGQPGGCKTATLVQIVKHMRDQGAYVAIAAYDEEPESLLIRIGQMIGLDRDALEHGDRRSIERLRAYVASPEWILVDGSGDDDSALEIIVERLIKAAADAGKPAVLMVDSIQTALVGNADDADSPRARVDAVVKVLKYARSRGVLVLAASEANRAFYRSREGRINALAAAKESGSIEYQSTVVLVLDAHDSETEGEPDKVAAYVAKNRLGRRAKEAAFWLTLDRTTATIHVCEPPVGYDAGDAPTRQQQRGHDRLARCGKEVERYIRQHEGATSKMLREGVKGYGKDAIDAARDWLASRGRIVSRTSTGQRGSHWHLSDEAKSDDWSA